MSERPETGPMQFGEDWPGCFIRGDNACYLGRLLQELLDTVVPPLSPIEYSVMEVEQLRSFIKMLQSADVRSGAQVHKPAPFGQCKEMK